MKKSLFACAILLASFSANATDYGTLTKQIQQEFGKSACNKVVAIYGAKDGTANIAECDTKIYTGNSEYFRITNNTQLPFIRCAALGSWEYYPAKKCRGDTR